MKHILDQRLVALLALVLLLGAAFGEAEAGGFIVMEQSARSAGMGGLAAPSEADPSRIFWNPAALSDMRGTNFSFGANVIMPDVLFHGISPAQTESRTTPQVIFPPNFYLTHTFRSGFGIGLGVNFPYAERLEWGSDWVGSTIVTRSEIRIASVRAAIGFPVGRSTSIGGAVIVNVPKLSIAQRIPSAADSSAAIRSFDGNGSPAFRFQVGILHEILSGITISLAYRTPVALRVNSGQVSSQDASGSGASTVVGDFITTIDLPHEFESGLSWEPCSGFVLSGRASLGLWSALKEQSLRFGTGPSRTVNVPLHWRNSASAAAGVEISLGGTQLRGGYRWEQSPIPDETLSPVLPDADAQGFSVGLGYHVEEGLLLDFSFSRLELRERNVTTSRVLTSAGIPFNGMYSGRTTSVGLNISYSWD
jgi:long-chain fatty acid transport protein